MKIKLKSAFGPEDILSEIRAGNERVLEHLYKKYFPSIRKFILRNNGNQEDAMDMMQEAIIVLWRKAQEPQFRLTSDTGTYLFAIAKYKWLAQLKQNIPVLKDESSVFEEAGRIIAEQQEEDSFFNSSLVGDLASYLEKISEKCREILTRFYYEKWSMERIATAMGFANADTVKTRKYKCIRRLREVISQQRH